MSRRIEIELTSQRPDGSWTWRAAGAREPKGELSGDLISFAASVGDELTVEAEFHMDGIEIIEVFEAKEKRPMPETLEILGSGRDQPLVTTQLVSTRKNRGRDRGDRREGQDRRGRGNRKDRDRQESRREDDRPKAKRLRPDRAHRQRLIESLPEEQQPVAEKMMRDGISSVEQALRDQRKKARDAAQAKKKAAEEAAKAIEEAAESKSPEADAKPEEPTPDTEAKPEKQPSKGKAPDSDSSDDFLTVAAKLLPGMRAAEWRDRVEAALAGIDELDLRDLRSVVVASESGATDEEAKALAEELRTKLTERVDREHAEWLAEVAATLADGRMVRALRLSSRPPKAGVPLPQDIVTRLTEAANAALTSETPSKRWITVMGAVAFSPVRRTVEPMGIPEKPDEELLAEVKKLSERIPHIAALFGVEPTPAPKRPRRRAGTPTASR
ncbi:hypothetical protein [Candidatus Poriferisocius sp.]|uniref:hypothetical protein n=1 Tax=Candidatus Poriferisocius sp. TaxID=3101276 RepID=UPI003B59E8FB